MTENESPKEEEAALKAKLMEQFSQPSAEVVPPGSPRLESPYRAMCIRSAMRASRRYGEAMAFRRAQENSHIELRSRDPDE